MITRGINPGGPVHSRIGVRRANRNAAEVILEVLHAEIPLTPAEARALALLLLQLAEDCEPPQHKVLYFSAARKAP